MTAEHRAATADKLLRVSPHDRYSNHHEVTTRDDGREYQTVVEGGIRYYRLVERRADGLWAGPWRKPDGSMP